MASQQESAGVWWLSLNENEINGKQVGTSKADCSSDITKCARNRQPQLLCICHGEEEVWVVNPNNYLILEMQQEKLNEKGTLCAPWEQIRSLKGSNKWLFSTSTFIKGSNHRFSVELSIVAISLWAFLFQIYWAVSHRVRCVPYCSTASLLSEL